MSKVSAKARFGSTKASATVVKVGDEMISLKRSGRSGVTTARILGRRTVEQGQVLWLDRIVHEDGEEFAGATATGAISTILTVETQRAA